MPSCQKSGEFLKWIFSWYFEHIDILKFLENQKMDRKLKWIFSTQARKIVPIYLAVCTIFQATITDFPHIYTSPPYLSPLTLSDLWRKTHHYQWVAVQFFQYSIYFSFHGLDFLKIFLDKFLSTRSVFRFLNRIFWKSFRISTWNFWGRNRFFVFRNGFLKFLYGNILWDTVL